MSSLKQITTSVFAVALLFTIGCAREEAARQPIPPPDQPPPTTLSPPMPPPQTTVPPANPGRPLVSPGTRRAEQLQREEPASDVEPAPRTAEPEPSRTPATPQGTRSRTINGADPESGPRSATEGRSKKESAAIIGGSAAAGAAIGAIAGGGKGAAIGALAGGAGGAVYDRATANKKKNERDRRD